MQSLKEELQKARETIQKVKECLSSLVEDALQNPIPGVNVVVVSDSLRVFTVSLKNITSSGDLCLAPSHYDVKEQKDAVLALIDGEDPLYAIAAIWELCSTGKSGSKYFKNVRFHPDVLNRLNEIIKEVA